MERTQKWRNSIGIQELRGIMEGCKCGRNQIRDV